MVKANDSQAAMAAQYKQAAGRRDDVSLVVKHRNRVEQLEEVLLTIHDDVYGALENGKRYFNCEAIAMQIEAVFPEMVASGELKPSWAIDLDKRKGTQ